MIRCGRCGREFEPKDEIRVSELPIPSGLFPWIRPHVTRLILSRCPELECKGLITALYMPRATLQAGPEAPPASGAPRT